MKEKLEVLEYRGIKFDIKLLSEGSLSLGIGGQWYVLEHSQTQKEVIALQSKISGLLNQYSDGFLYEDSLHSWNEGHSLEQRRQDMIEVAHREIDNFLDSTVGLMELRVKELRESIKEFKEFKRDLK